MLFISNINKQIILKTLHIKVKHNYYHHRKALFFLKNNEIIFISKYFFE